MQFHTFIQSITNLQNIALPFLESHQKMAPQERIEELLRVDFSKISYREAAVLILLYPKNDQTHLVLIERNEYNGVHSKQISLPGGKKETFDTNLEQTAIRETFEEIGIQPNLINLVTKLSAVYVPPSNFMISPYLGYINQEITFKPDAREVKSIIEVPLSTIFDTSIIKYQEITTSYAKMHKVPYYEIKEYVVWGATAMILSELIDIVKMSIK